MRPDGSDRIRDGPGYGREYRGRGHDKGEEPASLAYAASLCAIRRSLISLPAVDPSNSHRSEKFRPGGIAVFVPDHTRETFEETTDLGGTDGDDGRGARYL